MAVLILDHPLRSLAQEAPAKSAAEYGRDLASTDRDLKREAAYQLSRMGDGVEPALDALIAALDDNEQQVWFGAVTALSNLGPKAERAIPALLKELESWEPGRRGRQDQQGLYRTARALGSIGPAALPGLLLTLGHERWSARAGAAMAIGFLGVPGEAGIPQLVKLLGDSRREVRDAATEALAGMGPAALEPVAGLLSTGNTSELRLQACEVLRRKGDAARPVAEALRAAAAGDADQGVRASAVRAYARVAGRSGPVVPFLIEAWRSGNDLVQGAAKGELLLVRPVDPALLKALEEDVSAGTPAARARAAALVAELGRSAAPLAPLLARTLEGTPGDPDPALVRALARTGDAGWSRVFERLAQVSGGESPRWPAAVLALADVTTVPLLAARLNDSVPAVREGALQGVLAVGEAARRSVAGELGARLDDGDPRVRAAAWRAAARCGVAPEVLLGRLDFALRDTDPRVRDAALEALAEIGSAARSSVPRLVDEVRSSSGPGKILAIRTLAAVGADGASARAVLVEALEGAEPATAVELIRALGRAGAESAPAWPQVSPFASHENPALRRETMNFVAALQDSGKDALPVVKEKCGDTEAEVRAAAVEALVAVDPMSDETVERARQALSDPALEVRRSAAAAVGRLGERGRAAEEELFAMLERDGDRSAALEALRLVKPATVGRLVPALEHRDWQVRQWAADSLARLGKAAGEAVPSLEKLSRDDAYEDVKRAARRALRRIREG